MGYGNDLRKVFFGGLSSEGSPKYSRQLSEAIERLCDYAKSVKTEPDKLLNRFLDEEQEKERAGKDQEKNRINEQIDRCITAYNKYQACEPEKNVKYNRAFREEGGVLDCLKRYHEIMVNIFPAAKTLENMQLIVWGNGLQYLEAALEKLRKISEMPVKRIESREEWLDYLRQRGIPLKWERLEEIINTLNTERDSEEKALEIRKRYEKIQKELNNERIQKYISELKPFGSEEKQGQEEEQKHKYAGKANELDDIFTKLLSGQDEAETKY